MDMKEQYAIGYYKILTHTTMRVTCLTVNKRYPQVQKVTFGSLHLEEEGSPRGWTSCQENQK